MLFTDLLQRTLSGNSEIAPRRAFRFESGERPGEDLAPEVEFPAPAPPVSAEREPATPRLPAMTPSAQEEAKVVERLSALPLPVEPPSPRMEPHTIHTVREIETAPAVKEPAQPRPVKPPSETVTTAGRDIHTEVRHETERERIRETVLERLMVEKRLETLRTEKTRELVAVERPEQAPAKQPAAPGSAPQPVERVAARRARIPRELRVVAANTAVQPPQVPAQSPPAPSVQVTIGRVEIRAVAPPVTRSGPALRGPKQSLADYLRQREGA